MASLTWERDDEFDEAIKEIVSSFSNGVFLPVQYVVAGARRLVGRASRVDGAHVALLSQRQQRGRDESELANEDDNETVGFFVSLWFIFT